MSYVIRDKLPKSVKFTSRQTKLVALYKPKEKLEASKRQNLSEIWEKGI